MSVTVLLPSGPQTRKTYTGVSDVETDWGPENVVTIHFAAPGRDPEHHRAPGVTIETVRIEPTTAEKQTFITGVEQDEYAELRLRTGDTLITDWEGDETFNPYIIPRDGTDEVPDRGGERSETVAEAIEAALHVRVDEIEWARGMGKNIIGHVYMDRPTEADL